MNVYLKSILFGLLFAVPCIMYGQGSVGIGTTMPNPSAILDVTSTEKGFLPPRMTTAQRNAIMSPADGMIIFNTSTGCINYWFFGSWFETCGDQIVCPSSTVTFVYNGSSVTYGTVVGANNKCWLDRNLGANRVATSRTDTASYGDLFQWGRGTDGHQIRNPLSGITSILSSTDSPGHGNFITINSPPYDWRLPQNNNLWQGVSGENNPCPSGWRLPTDTEFNTEVTSWTSKNAYGAFNSPLKLPMGGQRFWSDGLLIIVGSKGSYWYSTVTSSGAKYLFFDISDVGIYGSGQRASAHSVRCIKN